jgi:hypothetical protein
VVFAAEGVDAVEAVVAEDVAVVHEGGGSDFYEAARNLSGVSARDTEHCEK